MAFDWVKCKQWANLPGPLIDGARKPELQWKTISHSFFFVPLHRLDMFNNDAITLSVLKRLKSPSKGSGILE